MYRDELHQRYIANEGVRSTEHRTYSTITRSPANSYSPSLATQMHVVKHFSSDVRRLAMDVEAGAACAREGGEGMNP